MSAPDATPGTDGNGEASTLPTAQPSTTNLYDGRAAQKSTLLAAVMADYENHHCEQLKNACIDMVLFLIRLREERNEGLIAVDEFIKKEAMEERGEVYVPPETPAAKTAADYSAEYRAMREFYNANPQLVPKVTWDDPAAPAEKEHEEKKKILRDSIYKQRRPPKPVVYERFVKLLDHIRLDRDRKVAIARANVSFLRLHMRSPSIFQGIIEHYPNAYIYRRRIKMMLPLQRLKGSWGVPATG
jgi:hypothetical protein